MTRRLPLAMLLLLAPTLPLAGCAAIPLAALGTALGVGASAVSTGASVYSLGKLNSAEHATADAVRHAAEATADELDFRTLRGGFDEAGRVYTVRWADALGATLDVVIDQRSARLTWLRIDVGVFGNEPTARLILERIRARLPNANARVDNAPVN